MKWRFTRLRSMLDNCSCNFAPVGHLSALATSESSDARTLVSLSPLARPSRRGSSKKTGPCPGGTCPGRVRVCVRADTAWCPGCVRGVCPGRTWAPLPPPRPEMPAPLLSQSPNPDVSTATAASGEAVSGWGAFTSSWSISGLSAATILVSSSFGSTSSHGRPCSSSTRLSMDCGGTSLSGRRAAVRMRASRGRRMQSCSEEPRAVTLKGDTQQVSCYHCQTSSLHACHQCDTLTTHCKHGVQLARSRRGRAKPKTDLVGWAAGNRECGKASEAQWVEGKPAIAWPYVPANDIYIGHCDDHRTALMPA